MNKIVESRNKHEGLYLGKGYGRHIRLGSNTKFVHMCVRTGYAKVVTYERIVRCSGAF